jgi:hypothetical protein
MDDIKNKSDEELQEIILASLPNQHVSSSIYHKAKQELQYRMDNEKKSREDISYTARAVLESLTNSKQGTDVTGKFTSVQVLEHQFTKSRMPAVNKALDELIARDFVEKYIQKGIYRLTPFGVSYLHDSSAGQNITYRDISNSNISHQSQNVNQAINISELPEDIQKTLKELAEGAEARDHSRMKKAFGYIADKAVDVAIAISLGRLKL